MLKKDLCALRPPMGWNSWDCYGASVNEAQLLGNAAYMAQHLKPFGWEYVVCDIQWFEPTANSNDYHPFADLCMDAYSRLIPAPNRFPRGFGTTGAASCFSPSAFCPAILRRTASYRFRCPDHSSPTSCMVLRSAPRCSSEICVRGRRSRPLSCSKSCMAAFTGMGLVSMKSAVKRAAYLQ